MKTGLFLILFSSMVAADDIETNELVIHCRGAVSLAKDMAKERFVASDWSLGVVTNTDIGAENAVLPSGLQGELLVRQVNVTANTLPGKDGQDSKNEMQFQVKGEPYPVNLTFKTRG